MKTFGIGLHKTGTTSLAAAMNTVGVKTKHGPTDSVTIKKLIRCDYRLPVLDVFDGVTDVIAPFYAELDTQYPNSRFILTVRDKLDWLVSVKSFWKTFPVRRNCRSWQYFSLISYYGGVDYNAERMSRIYDLHVQQVVEYFANTERLLVFDVRSGWVPLCVFLGVAIPDGPFPHLNQQRS